MTSLLLCTAPSGCLNVKSRLLFADVIHGLAALDRATGTGFKTVIVHSVIAKRAKESLKIICSEHIFTCFCIIKLV